MTIITSSDAISFEGSRVETPESAAVLAGILMAWAKARGKDAEARLIVDSVDDMFRKIKKQIDGDDELEELENPDGSLR
jgi:hypothetical protein